MSETLFKVPLAEVKKVRLVCGRWLALARLASDVRIADA